MPLTTIDQLVTIEQCEEALQFACYQQKNLLWKKMGLELKIERRQNAMSALDTKLRRKKAQLDIVTFRAGEGGDESIDFEKRGLELEIAVLEARRLKLDPNWLVEKELMIESLTFALQGVSLSVLELETHLARLKKSSDAGQVKPEIESVKPEVKPVESEPGTVKAETATEQPDCFAELVSEQEVVSDIKVSPPQPVSGDEILSPS